MNLATLIQTDSHVRHGTQDYSKHIWNDTALLNFIYSFSFQFRKPYLHFKFLI